jgi:DNA-binding LacI/PurR family transcriptional regulator
MGSQAASAMLDLLAGQPPSVALPSPELVPRESTRALPA